jgi:5-methylcytosine-specific restriction protein B
MNESLYQLKEDFLAEWPLSRIQKMSLDEYTNLDKTSFCYWLEAKTNDLGSIWGGSAYKFGIYKRRDISTTITVDNRITDGEYAWFQKYGTTKEEAFQTVKDIILSIIKNIQNNTLEKIDPIDLGDAYKWKIAFLYGNFNVVNIFKNESLFEAAISIGYKENNKNYAALNHFILSKKEAKQDYFEFTAELWQKTSLANPKKYWIYAPGENASKWEEFYQEGIMGLGWDDLGDLDQYASKNEIKKKLQELEGVESSKKNDTVANFEFHKVIKEGDIVITKKGISELLGYGVITSDYFYDENRKSYQKCRKVDWKLKGNWKVDFNLPLKTLTDITKYPTEDPNFNKYHEKLIAIMEGSNSQKSIENNMNNYQTPLNQILYGPPGTGKTYNTVLESAKIVTGNEAISYDEALLVFNDNLGNQIEFITFHQNYSYEDFIQGLRPDTENGDALTFEKKDGVFKRIADKALENLKLSMKAPEELSNEALFDRALEEFKETILDTEDKYQINETAYIFEIEKDAFRYTGEKWGYVNGLRMKFNDLKEFYRNGVKSRKEVKSLSSISGLANQHATYYYLVYEQILKHLPKKLEEHIKIDRKNYVIIIDEINRANISRVFGELITLIEEDKRSHGKIPMRVTLPSGDTFIVPSNLFIIGTMNTADKSIALLDIALRRRFEFIAMYPDAALVNNEFREIFTAINKAILERKNHDFTIGHAYFMGEDCKLEKIINNKVIPLLMEYFMNDEKEVTAILQAAKITIGGWPLKMIV